MMCLSVFSCVGAVVNELYFLLDDNGFKEWYIRSSQCTNCTYNWEFQISFCPENVNLIYNEQQMYTIQNLAK